MLYEDGLKCGYACPVKLVDGRVGSLVRFNEIEVGIQVPGEINIYWLPWKELVDIGGCVLEEIDWEFISTVLEEVVNGISKCTVE